MPCQSFLQHKSSVSKTLPEGAAGTDAHILYFPVTEVQVQDKTEKIHVLTAFFFFYFLIRFKKYKNYFHQPFRQPLTCIVTHTRRIASSSFTT